MVLILVALCGPAQGQNLPINAYDFSNFAGQPGTTGSSEGTGSDARFNYPRGVAVDSAGNAYVADYYNNTIRKVTPAGAVTTLAGLAGTAGSADGTGSAARFDRPYGIAVDNAGNVYVTCLNVTAGTIRKITPAGLVTTLAGAAAGILSPSGIVADGSGNLFVADSYYNTIRKITPTGVITTVAGQSGTSGWRDGTGTAAWFYNPNGLAIDGAGNLFVADSKYGMIRKVTAAGAVTTIAGTAGSGSVDGTGNEAKFNLPMGISADSVGNLYVADQGNNTVRRLSLTGSTWTVTTMAGSAGSTGTNDGAGSAARFNQPQGVAVGSGGALFVADMGNQRITKGTPVHLYIPPTITTAALLPAGTVGQGYNQTLAATGGTPPYTWTLVSGSLPSGLNLSTGGVISGTFGALPTVTFTARVTGGDDAYTERTFTIDAPPTITTSSPLPSGTVGTMYPSQPLAATGGATPFTWALASGSLPAGMNLNPSNGYIYGTPTLAANATFVVRVTSSSGLFSTKSLSLTILPIIASPALLPAGTVGAAYSQTLAATGGTGPYTWALAPGSSLPPGWTLTSDGTLTGEPGDGTTFSFTIQVTDNSGVSTIKTFTLSFKPAIPTIVTRSLLRSGSVGVAYNEVLMVDGGAAPYGYGWTLLSGSLPPGLTLGGGGTVAGVIYGVPEAEGTAHFSVQVTAGNGLTATKAFRLTINPAPVATELYSFSNFVGLPGTPGSTDGTGSAAQMNYPAGLGLDSAGNLYVTESMNGVVRKVTPAGAVTTFAGTAGVAGSADGTGSEARFYGPRSAAVDNAGNLFVVDGGNHTIRKVTPTGVVTTFAGSPGLTGKTDSTGSEARFNGPSGIALIGGGTLYVVDTSNHTIRQVTPAGVVTTLAGSAGMAGRSDGAGSTARFSQPQGVALDSTGNLFVADWGNNTIRKVTSAGTVTTIAGSPWISSSDTGIGSTDGMGATARFYYPNGVAIDGRDNLYVTDYYNHTIRKVTPAGMVTTVAGSAGITGSADGIGSAARFFQPSGITVDAEGNLYVADLRNHRIAKGTPLYEQPMITKANPLLDGMAGRAYNDNLTALGGTAPYTWSVVSGTLPAGLNLGGDGVIAGTPETEATADFTVRVNDSNTLSTTKAFRLTVNPPLTITTISPMPTGTVGMAYSQTLAASGGGAFYTWSIAGGTLPAGLNLRDDGLITGTLENATTASFTLRVTDIDGLSTTKGFGIAVNQPPTIVTASPLPAGAVGAAYSQTLKADSGTAPYTWTLASGSLPPGLGLSSGGVISGTPDTKTTAGFTVQAIGANALSSTKAFGLAIHLRGDINDDGEVDLADAILVMQVLSDTTSAPPVHTGADVNGDGQIGLPEAVFILQKAAGVR